MKMLRNKKGFTLVEVLMVIVIIAIIATIAIPAFLGAPAKARDKARIQDLTDIAAFLQYQVLENYLPNVAGATGTALANGCIYNETDLTTNPSPNSRLGYFINVGRNGIAPSFLANFKGRFPSDPKGATGKFGTTTCANGGYYLRACVAASPYKYAIYAKVEKPKDNGNTDVITCVDPTSPPSGSTIYYGAFVKK